MPSVMGDDALLEKALKDLAVAWDATADGWRDEARTAFADQHLHEMEARIRLAVRTIRQLDTLLKEAITQCS